MSKKNLKYLTIGSLIIGIIVISYSVVGLTIHQSFRSNFTISEDFTITHVDGILRIDKYYDLDINQNQLDQIQDNNNNGAHHMNPTVCQSIKNDRSPMYGFSIMLGIHGNPTKPMVIGLMSSLLTGDNLFDVDNWDWIATISPSIFPSKDTMYWLTAEFTSPINYEPGKTFYLACLDIDNSYEQGNYFKWGASGEGPGDTYENGKTYGYDGSKWVEWSYNQVGDTCFKTWTTESTQPPPNEPDISINITTNVITASIGIGCIAVSVVSGTKYFGWF
jgi:hypothetical protein